MYLGVMLAAYSELGMLTLLQVLGCDDVRLTSIYVDCKIDSKAIRLLERRSLTEHDNLLQTEMTMKLTLLAITFQR